jgi:hypothetical protein
MAAFDLENPPTDVLPVPFEEAFDVIPIDRSPPVETPVPTDRIQPTPRAWTRKDQQ